MTPEPPDEPTVEVIFREPLTMPGTPEAHRAGCICGFESNMSAAFYAAESPKTPEGMTAVTIKDGCPLHEIVKKPAAGE